MDVTTFFYKIRLQKAALFFVLAVLITMLVTAYPSGILALIRSDHPFPPPTLVWEVEDTTGVNHVADQYSFDPVSGAYSIATDWASIVHHSQQCAWNINNFEFTARLVSGNSATLGTVTSQTLAGLTARTTLNNSWSTGINFNVDSDPSVSRLRVNFLQGSTIYRQTTPYTNLPIWLKLKKQGTTVSAAYSADGISWTNLSKTLNLAAPTNNLVNFGLLNRNLAETTKVRPMVSAVFDHVTSLAYCSSIAPTPTPTIDPHLTPTATIDPNLTITPTQDPNFTPLPTIDPNLTLTPTLDPNITMTATPQPSLTPDLTLTAAATMSVAPPATATQTPLMCLNAACQSSTGTALFGSVMSCSVAPVNEPAVTYEGKCEILRNLIPVESITLEPLSFDSPQFKPFTLTKANAQLSCSFRICRTVSTPYSDCTPWGQGI